MSGRNIVKDWLGLIRATNLLIIILCQLLAWYFIIRPFFELNGLDPQLSWLEFIMLVLSTVFIAAGGYIVNDLYDIDVDEFNKRKNIIGRKLTINSAWTIYLVLNIIAFILGFYLAINAGSFQLGFIFVVIAGMLYLYSQRYQSKLLTGNIIVALTSAMVILVVWLFEFMFLRTNPDNFVKAINVIPVISWIIWSYALFAFLVSVIREFIKDIQDIEGDTRFGSYTLPVAIGIERTKVIIIVSILTSIALLGLAQYFLLSYGFRYAFWFLMLTVQLMFIYLLINIIRAKSSRDFAFPSLLSKLIMLVGVLSMQLIYIEI